MLTRRQQMNSMRC